MKQNVTGDLLFDRVMIGNDHIHAQLFRQRQRPKTLDAVIDRYDQRIPLLMGKLYGRFG